MSPSIAQLFTILIFTLLEHGHLITQASNLNCNTDTDQCRNTLIQCSPNEDCLISCDSTQACYGSTINCPINGDCQIICKGGRSCQNTIINATKQSSGSVDVLCIEGTDHCKNMKVYGSTYNSNTDDFHLRCNGLLRACIHSEINCPLNGKCHIQCESESSCRWMEVHGGNGTKSDLIIDCEGTQSCFDGEFEGYHASELYINGCTEYESCMDLTLYCPPLDENNGMKNCFIQGNDELGRDNAGGTRIYAINGWNDIDIDYSGGYTTNHGGKMLCGEDYGRSCNIATDAWTCSNEDDHCNDIHLFTPMNTTEMALVTTTEATTKMYTTSKQSVYSTPSQDSDDDDTSTTSTREPDINSTKTQVIVVTLFEETNTGETKSGFMAIFNNEYPLEARIAFGGAVIFFILCIGCLCYCRRKCKLGKKSTKRSINNLDKMQNISSWPKVDGIDDDFYPSTTKDSKEIDEEIIISSPNDNHIIDASITNTFPENRMVRTPKPNEVPSSHPAAESFMVAMIEQQLLMSHGGKFPTIDDDSEDSHNHLSTKRTNNGRQMRDFHDPRSPNAKLSISTRDRYYSDDVLALNPELMDENKDNHNQRDGRKASDIITVTSSKTSEQVIAQYRNNKKLSTSSQVTGTTQGRFHTTTIKASPRNDKNGPYVEMTEQNLEEMDEMDIDDEDDENEDENEDGNNMIERSETTMSSKSETNLKVHHEEDKGSPINQRPKKSVVTDVETIGTIRKSNDKDEIRTASIFSGDHDNHIGNIDVSNIDLIASTKDIHNIDINGNGNGKEEVDDDDDNDKYIFSASSLQSPNGQTFNPEMMNPVNTIPTTVPSIFSPTANYQ